MDNIINWLNENQPMLQENLIKFIIAVAIFIIGRLFAKLISSATKKVLTHKKFDNTVISFIASLIYGLVVMVAFIAAISHLGFNTTSLVAIVGAAGLAIGLALQGSLSNFASGILLISLKPFKAGDFVEIAGTAGIVEEVHVFSTQLRTGDNKTVIIPNGGITNGTITNYSAKPTRRIDLVIGVGYSADLKLTKKILKDVVSRHDLVLKEPAITIGVSALADSSVNFIVRPWVKTADYWPVHFDLLEAIKMALDDAGIEIPFPQLSVHVNQETKNEQ
ncbi:MULTISPECIES: mechanosensitive ion channel family protein [unclassified Colwellia]|uniref:mechanosensitive ion channel family protein n=1 Tax=unclassified Colwellia TaxID=196834 RepID=UPI0015F3F473|nr:MULTISPECIES: mechanosensitive ion channel domain-containing protein [unclassified Colwellia]MBA6233235.1 mechanosensitive ion channel [Colwellia sp. MB02u-7]MBA6236325.1 mechanosensitive ion channel [Colwellia sp. MB02u-11]MBA6256859.1 mechanosensitive ion channel [Colwellia sp. MB3u-28]MBA6261135.1 mechanosensitive ion channel [Colwellia sp. MB3u-41]MBA6298275.1 mechanosensitive ion channel [Colwellia sp. MB3u-22]